ncbi:MAG: NADP-dependent oxidoreductase [Thermoanaerobaculales bacterium]|jgi:NADPH-dependent curcumin reductase CurA|nr:NADP-dependent oxidoreductase [Thermoanaerobaculales bacterium]
MASIPSREIHLVRRAEGEPTPENFALVETTLDEPGAGEVRVQNLWLSVDPYMRGLMGTTRTYVDPYHLGEVMTGAAVGTVEASRHPKLAEGDLVLSNFGWRERFVASGDGVHPVDPNLAPPQAYLGVMGMPGFTAWLGIHEIARLEAGESIFVTGAAGAVGSVACQLARRMGAKVVASAGTDEKVDWLAQEAGVEAFNYKKTKHLYRQLVKVCRDGFHVTFDNVGGDHLEAALLSMRDHGRVVLCGMIGQYNAEHPPAGPSSLIVAITKRLSLRGFIAFDHSELEPRFQAEMAGLIAGGHIRWTETVYDGIENAPGAFMGLFTGANTGKMLVRL